MNQNNTARRPMPPNVRPLPPLAESVKQAQAQAVAAQPPVPVQPASPPPAPVQQVAQVQQTQEAQHARPLQSIPLIQAETYLSLGSEEQGVIEFDLMSHREKGRELRYLNIQVHGLSTDGVPNSSYMSIMNKEDFEKVKSFFSTLKWED